LTFIHGGITGLINSVYNGGNLTLIILDNSTTGMTGHQDHPATGYTLKKTPAKKLDLESLCRACGAGSVEVVDAYNIAQVEDALKRHTGQEGVSVIIARRPCVLLDKKYTRRFTVNTEKCTGCRMCLRLGCPSISFDGKKAGIDEFCTGCGICAEVCRFNAIEETK
jgi:indolepyruvate ferredoxin oxidoreductase alpha subunit